MDKMAIDVARKCCENAMKQVEKSKKALMVGGTDATPGDMREIIETIRDLDDVYLSLYTNLLKITILNDDTKTWM